MGIFDRTDAEKKLVDVNRYRLEQGLQAGHTDWIAQAMENDRYYMGGGLQWTDRQRKLLNASGRPTAELNQIFTAVNTVLGYQSQVRLDLSFKPRNNGDTQLSRVLTQIGMYVLDHNDYAWEESQAFSDGVILGRGYLDCRMDFQKNSQGEVKIVAEDPFTVIPDPDAQTYDPEGWADVIRVKWKTLEEIEAEYGTRARKRVEYYSKAEGDDPVGGEGIYLARFSDPSRENSYAAYTTNYYADGSDDTIKPTRVKLIERQYWKTTRAWVLLDMESGDEEPVPAGWTTKQSKEFAEANGYNLIRKPVRRVRWSVTTRHIKLFDDWSPYDSFTIIPYFPHFRRGITRGMVDNLKSPQDILNKSISQMLHIISSTANSGWVVEENSLANMTVDQLEDEGSRTGLVLEHKMGTRAPERIQPNQIPSGLNNMANIVNETIPQISGVSRLMAGQKSNEVSGVAIQSRAQQNEIPLASILDSLNRTRHILGRKVLRLMQDYYTDNRVLTVTEIDKEGNEQQNDVEINGMDQYGEFVNDLAEGDYDVVIADMPAQTTELNAQLAQAVEMRKFGVEIPDSFMVQYSDLKDKEKLSEILKQREGIDQQPSPEEQMMEEIQLKMAKLEQSKLEVDILTAKVAAYKTATDAGKNVAESPLVAPIAQSLVNDGDATTDIPLAEMEQQLASVAEGRQQGAVPQPRQGE